MAAKGRASLASPRNSNSGYHHMQLVGKTKKKPVNRALCILTKRGDKKGNVVYCMDFGLYTRVESVIIEKIATSGASYVSIAMLV